MGGRGEEDQEEVEEEGEAGVLPSRQEEAEGEEPRGSRRGREEGEEGGSLCWEEAAEEAERTCPVGMEEEEGARRQELWRGGEAEGLLDPVREEGEGEVLRCGGGGEEEEEGRLGMEEEEELVSVAHF